MFWTSIKIKTRHLLRIVLTYIAYESNLSILLSRLEVVLLTTILLLFSVFI